MLRDPRAFLWDVKQAAMAVQSFTEGLDGPDYVGNALVQAAVERKFEIIGEALSQLSKLAPELAAQVPYLSQTIAFRNQLIHGYAKVNHLTVWNVIQDSLPGLLVKVQALLESQQQG